MDWRNIVRPIIIIAIAVCVVVVGVHKIKDTYTGFMREYEGTEGLRILRSRRQLEC